MINTTNLKLEPQLVKIVYIPMNAFVSITPKSTKMEQNMLISTLSFLHPMVIIRNDDNFLDFKLYDVDTEEKLNDKLNYLSEASSVDFSYSYAFVK